MRLMACLVWIVALFAATSASALDVTIRTEAARAVVDAVGNRALDREQALQIARLPGNRELIRKSRDFSEAASEERFVDELMAVATGAPLAGETVFALDRVKRDREALMATLSAIEQDRAGFVAGIAQRVSAFSPPGLAFPLTGHLIAGGGSTGFAFGGPEFFLNIAHFANDLDAARASMAHELYHAMQASARLARGIRDEGFDEARFAAMTPGPERQRYVVELFLNSLAAEGLAIYVGDPAPLTGEGWMSRFERGRLVMQQGRMDRLATQLDMSLLSLTADQPVSFGAAYALGFYGPDQPLYYLGYAMAKALAEAHGNARLAAHTYGTGCGFVQDYLRLTATRADLPKLGEVTARIVQERCPATG